MRGNIVTISSGKAIYYYMMGDDYTEKEKVELRRLIHSNSLTKEELRDCWEVHTHYLYKESKGKKEKNMILTKQLRKEILREWSPYLRLANNDRIKHTWNNTLNMGKLNMSKFEMEEFKELYEEFKKTTGREIEVPIETKIVEYLNLSLEEGDDRGLLGRSEDGYINMYIEQFYKEHKVYTLSSIIRETERMIKELENRVKSTTKENSVRTRHLKDKIESFHTQVFTGMVLARNIGI